MGVPAFFRWISMKYPKIISDVVERKMVVVDGIAIPFDLREDNPNGVEYDNLYVDMNGLIHPCSHPEDRPPPQTEEEMYIAVTKYLDRLFAAVRPRRLLFLAIDGVAPRAKMNQQRSRRFRAVRDTRQKKEMLNEVKQEMLDLGLDVPSDENEAWDANVITPGTPFMHRLSEYIRFYILDKMNKAPAWKNIKVIFSDATVPGEGEHKIMNFIRAQRSQPGYDPNQRHILHGLDADLIMLALATHEVHFSILREKIFMSKREKESGPVISQAQLLLDEKIKQQGGSLRNTLNHEDSWVHAKPLQVLNVDILRDYLENEFQLLGQPNYLPFKYELERVIDDFVFLCFFVGNDFLPHLPSLDIRDGALDFLIECYKHTLPTLGNYLTSPGGNVNLQQVDIILAKVGEVEDEVFQLRKATEDKELMIHKRMRQQENAKRAAGSKGKLAAAAFERMAQENGEKLLRFGSNNASKNDSNSNYNNSMDVEDNTPNITKSTATSKSPSSGSNLMEITNDYIQEHLTSFEHMKTELKIAMKKLQDFRKGDGDNLKLGGSSDKFPNSTSNEDPITTVSNLVADAEAEVDGDAVDEDDEIGAEVVDSAVAVVANEKFKEEVKSRMKNKMDLLLDKYRATVQDHVRLHEKGWKDRYYNEPYKRDNIEEGGGMEKLRQSYIEGLCWVLKYYYEGCPSWSWYYPFHYAPFASDLLNIDSYKIEFELGAPFSSVEQLLAVLPVESRHALPESCSWLMTDQTSPIIDIYDSTNVPLDPNGKFQEWQWILLLPFLDSTRVSKAFDSCRDHLTEEDKKRNDVGSSVMFYHRHHSLGNTLFESSMQLSSGQSDTFGQFYDKKNNIDDGSTVAFDTSSGNGIAGQVSLPPGHFYARIDGDVTAPERPPGIFNTVKSNQVACVTYMLPTELLHESKLLDGACRDPCPLNSNDLAPRRPPRLNRGKYNIVDMAVKIRNRQEQQYNTHSTFPRPAMAMMSGSNTQGQLSGHGYGYGPPVAALGMSMSNRSIHSMDNMNMGSGHNYNRRNMSSSSSRSTGSTWGAPRIASDLSFGSSPHSRASTSSHNSSSMNMNIRQGVNTNGNMHGTHSQSFLPPPPPLMPTSASAMAQAQAQAQVQAATKRGRGRVMPPPPPDTQGLVSLAKLAKRGRK